jgi:hypothetical protein
MNDVMTQMSSGTVNGINVDALKQVVSDVSQDPAKGAVRFQVTSAWQGQTRSRATVESAPSTWEGLGGLTPVG